MSAFTRNQRPFVCHGIKLNALAKDLPPGKYPVLLNIRTPIQGTIQTRDGLNTIGSSLGVALHSVIQLDDPTPVASTTPVRVLGAGASVFLGGPNGPFNNIDTGYSGDPLTWATGTPPSSPQPWLYIADRSRMRKVNTSATVYPIGIAPPLVPPTTALDAYYWDPIQQFGAIFIPWVSVGAAASPLGAYVVRINTTISSILYDSGVIGNASIVPATMDGIAEGCLVSLNSGEVVAVAQITIAVASTTIGAIIYDAGTTGFCTIQPAGSLGVGQLDVPTVADYASRLSGDPQEIYAGDTMQVGLPPETSTRIRQIDFPVNCLVTIGVETVRIQSVALGPDGVQSFRCSTAGAHAAGEAIVGVAAFRAYTQGTHAPGETLTDQAITNTITPVAPTPPNTGNNTATAGVASTASFSHNLAQISGRATLPDDELHLSVRFSDTTAIATVRLYFDVDPTVNDYTQNYYFMEWRSADIIAAIQNANTNTVATLQAVRSTTVSNAQLNTTIALPLGGSLEKGGTANPALVAEALAAAAASNNAASRQIAFGNNQWIDLRCRIRDLIHVGTDTSRTLADCKACEVLVSVSSPVLTPVVVAYDSIYISGGFGPDAGVLGAPLVYWQRFRSTITGARSNPSPATRAGVIPHRQQIIVSGTQSPDPQCDVIDWFRQGGALTVGTYVGTTANVPNPVFRDPYADSALIGGETLAFDVFQPWPSETASVTGTCNVAGNAIRLVSGGPFNTSWAPGTTIIVNGQPFTLYSQPPSTTLIYVNENAGSGGGLAFTVQNPVRLGQPMATWWGGAVQGATVFFTCGDTYNPGFVHWTTPNNPETTSDANVIEVCPASEPLQNGYLYDGVPFVASSDNIYVLESTGNPDNPFKPQITPAGRGFWTRWAFCTGPEGCYFLAKDGIYLTTGGGVAVSITDEDLYPLFPHDGVPGFTVNGYIPPDLTQTANLKLTNVDQFVYFDYKGTDGNLYTLLYRKKDAAWLADTYGNTASVGVTARFSETGPQNHVELVGMSSGQLFTPQAGRITDGASLFNCKVQFTDNQNDDRREKLYRDFMLDANQGGSITVTLGLTNNQTLLTPVNLAGLGAGPFEYFVNVFPQIGGYGLNITSLMTWASNANANQVRLNVWDIAYQLTPELATSWLSGPTTHGFRAFQQVYQFLLAYRATGACVLSLIIDGTTYTYNVPTSAGQYAKVPIVLQARKGLTFQYGLQTIDPTTGCQVFDQDCESWVSVWGLGGYQQVRPF